MKRALILLLCAATLLSTTACKKKTEEPPAAVTTTTEKVTPTYAIDPTINRFFTEYIEKFGKEILDPQSIRRGAGTASTKPEDLTKEYIATINGLTVTVRNASYTAEPEGDEPYEVYLLRIIIEGGTTEKSRDYMMQIFAQIAQTVDPGCTAAMTDKAIADMEKMTATGDYRVSSYVKVERYTPINEEYNIPTKIEMLAMNYAPPADKK